MGGFVRSSSANIERLQAMLASAPAAGAGSPARAGPPSPDLLAHRQGMVLILSERLAEASRLFDRLRSLRYQQLQAAEAARARRLPRSADSEQQQRGPMTTGELHARLAAGRRPPPQLPGGQPLPQQQADGDAAAGSGGGWEQGHQAQALIDRENEALQLELLSMGDQVQRVERTVREVATLNQMFSTAILQQSEQIEKLYAQVGHRRRERRSRGLVAAMEVPGRAAPGPRPSQGLHPSQGLRPRAPLQAVEATHNISAANVQLGKAIRANSSSRKFLLLFFLLASLCILLLDWWYS